MTSASVEYPASRNKGDIFPEFTRFTPALFVPRFRQNVGTLVTHEKGGILSLYQDSGGDGGGGGGPSCGESDEHIKLKSIAASKLEHDIFADNCLNCELEYRIESTTSNVAHRDADALLLFQQPDQQLGQGVAIEVQYRNEAKDKRAVERDYLENNISTVWVEPDDFGAHDMLLDEVDIRHRAEQAAKNHLSEYTSLPTAPSGHPPEDHVQPTLHAIQTRRHERSHRRPRVPTAV